MNNALTLTSKLEDLARMRHEKPAQVIAEAFEIGLSRLWTDSVLKQYFQRHISRKKTIQLLGKDMVKLAEYQKEITHKDIKWGLGDASLRH